jgi:antitoxin component YwqK of YwqJK toxin-antitoxin module
MIRKLYYRLFKRYRRIEMKFVTYAEADKLMRKVILSPTDEWHLAKEEDKNSVTGMVYIERKERITG